MPADFNSCSTSTWMYSIYADYIPTNVIGLTYLSTGSNYSTDRRAMPFTMTEDGVIHSVSIYHNGGSGDMLLAVYSDDSGYPDYRWAVTDETAVNSTAGWQTIELTKSILVEEGQTIWLTWLFESNPGVRTYDDSPNSGRAASGVGWSIGCPEEFGSSTLSNWKYAICANYSPIEQDEVELIGNPYMFTARRYETETGLYYYRARYYNPIIGRFIQTDPAYDGVNLYTYCRNNPTNYVDPSGLLTYYPSLPDWAFDSFEAWEIPIVNDALCGTDPCFSLPTGNILILPSPWDPSYKKGVKIFNSAASAIKTLLGIKGKIGLIFNLYNKAYEEFIGKYIGGKINCDPLTGIIGQYLEVIIALSKNPDILFDIGVYRAFIQIQEYKLAIDVEGNHILEEYEKIGKPYYVEVVYCVGWFGTLNSFGRVTPGSGHKTAEQAWNAALTGIGNWQYERPGVSNYVNYPEAFLDPAFKGLGAIIKPGSIFATKRYYDDFFSLFIGDIPE